MKACFLDKLQVVANHGTQEMRGGMLSSNIQEPVSHVRYQTNNIYSWSVSLLKLKSERRGALGFSVLAIFWIGFSVLVVIAVCGFFVF